MRRILSAVTLLVMVVTFTGCGPLGDDKMTVHAKMADSAGLFVGNDVGILGVPVGKITAIEPAGDSVRVTMEIDADQSIPADAGAVVVARSVATDRYVELTPVFKSGPKMADGAEIDINKTQTPVDFDNVLSALNTLATNIAGRGQNAEAIAKVIESGSKTLKGKGGTINTSITSLAAAVNAVSNQRGNITGTLKSLDTLTAVLAKNQGTVRTFIDQVAKASALLAAERQNFRVAVKSFSSAVQLVAQFAKDNRARVTKSLDQMTDVIRVIMAKRGDLRELIATMPLALQNLQKAGGNNQLLVRADLAGLLGDVGGLLATVCGATVGNLPVAGQTVCGLLEGLPIDFLNLGEVFGPIINIGGALP